MKPVRSSSQAIGSKHDEGAVLVETAFVLPLLTLLLLIAVDLGLILREHEILQNAAREGARFSALPANWISPLNPTASESRIKQQVTDYCQQESISVSATSVTVNQNYSITIGGVTAQASEIRVTYTRSPLIPGAPFLSAGPFTLTGRSVFRNLY